jgi:hypothetical protein
MQRRAAAIYAVFFIVIGVASYSLIATATAPTLGFPDAEHRYAANDTFSVGDQQYIVDSVDATVSGGGGGHGGGGGGVTHTAVFAWENQSDLYTETWENNSTVTYDDGDWRVLVPNASDPGEFTLQEEQNRTAILQDDPNADNETVTRDGEKYVVVEENDSTTLVPADEYFPAPDSQQFDEGQTIDYRGNETTIANVSTSGVVLEWNAPKTYTTDVSQEGNVTLGDETYLAFFPNNDTVVLTQDYQSYNEQSNAIDEHHERVNGFWGVSIVSIVTALLLVGFAYMPSRY